MDTLSNTTTSTRTLAIVLDDVKQLTKVGLSFSVVFSSVAGYLLGAEFIDWTTLLMLAVGGFCLVGASNTFNQIIERDLDAKMKRTKNRPIPAGRFSPKAAFWLATCMTIGGVGILYVINPITAMFGAISIFLYTCAYTPLKTLTPLSVFVGAFPGAIPFMLGWVAATGEFGIEPGTLFMIQFFWQFPHFWAIGWMLDDDYKDAGFKMLPTGKKDRSTAFQCIIYTIWLIIVSVFPVLKMTGGLYILPATAIIVGLLGLTMLFFAIRLYQKRDNTSARALMLASVSYITLLQIVYVVDKFLH